MSKKLIYLSNEDHKLEFRNDYNLIYLFIFRIFKHK